MGFLIENWLKVPEKKIKGEMVSKINKAEHKPKSWSYTVSQILKRQCNYIHLAHIKFPVMAFVGSRSELRASALQTAGWTFKYLLQGQFINWVDCLTEDWG